MDEQVSPKEFNDRLLNFRDRMGDKTWTEAQRQSGFKMLTLSYLNCTNPLVVVDTFQQVAQEYVKRMEMMGMKPVA